MVGKRIKRKLMKLLFEKEFISGKILESQGVRSRNSEKTREKNLSRRSQH